MDGLRIAIQHKLMDNLGPPAPSVGFLDRNGCDLPPLNGTTFRGRIAPHGFLPAATLTWASACANREPAGK